MSESTDPSPGGKRQLRDSQVNLAALLFVCMAGSILAWFASDTGLSESGLYFIAIPGCMAIMVTLIPTKTGATTTFGVARGTTIAILASAILIREGLICVLMALPLIIPIVSLVAWASSPKRKGQVSAFLIPLALLGVAGEGAVYDLPDRIEASETRIIDATSEALFASLAEPAVLPELQPLLLKLPFPRPTAFTGEGVEVGDFRIVEFGDKGQLTLQISDRTTSSVTWAMIEDTTPMAGWMDFHETTASWTNTPEGLELTVQISFSRSLSPALYFDPLQRWGVGEMAEVLIDMMEHNVVTPAHG